MSAVVVLLLDAPNKDSQGVFFLPFFLFLSFFLNTSLLTPFSIVVWRCFTAICGTQDIRTVPKKECCHDKLKLCPAVMPQRLDRLSAAPHGEQRSCFVGPKVQVTS